MKQNNYFNQGIRISMTGEMNRPQTKSMKDRKGPDEKDQRTRLYYKCITKSAPPAAHPYSMCHHKQFKVIKTEVN